MTKQPNKFDPIENRLRRELRQQAEQVHISTAARERFRNTSVHLSQGPLYAKEHPRKPSDSRALWQRLRAFWHGETEIPIPIATVVVAAMVTSLAVASGVGTGGDSFPWQQKSVVEQPSVQHAAQPTDSSDGLEGERNGSDGVEIVSLSMEWVDPLW